MASINGTSKKAATYRQVFRLIFVVFFLYLAGNLFRIWSGFRGYASDDFLPSVALVLLLWCFLAAITALLVWLICRVVESVCLQIGWKITFDHLLLYAAFIALTGALIWLVKKLLWPDVQLTLQLGLIVLVFGAVISLIPGWLFRGKANLLAGIQGKIAPLVWIFGILVVLSVPFVVYNIWQEIQIVTVDSAFTMDNNPPLVTFVFDDGYESTYTRAKHFFDAQDEVACAGITLDYIGKKNRMTASQILELQNIGWEILGHSITHPDLTKMTGEEIDDELRRSKDGLSALGFKVVNFVYPFYRHNANARAIAKKYYRSARSGDIRTSGLNINQKSLRMYALSAIDIEVFDTIAVLKRLVDDAEANNSWLMITAHNMNPYRERMLDSLIDYIQGRGIKIVTINQGLDMVNNTESRIAHLLLILNVDSPLHILRNVHIVSQQLLNLFHNFLLTM